MTARLSRCAHPHCRTAVNDAEAVQCPHGLTFCDVCVWEEACEECASPLVPDLLAALSRSVEQAKAIRAEQPAPPAKPPAGPRHVPDPNVGSTAHHLKAWTYQTCDMCRGAIHLRQPIVVHRPLPSRSTVAYHYHPECWEQTA